MSLKTLDDLNLEGKRVLVRIDINVPMSSGRITDDTRMREVVPTIREILAQGGKPILLAHFGRPKGEVVPDLSLKPLAQPLAELLGSPVTYAEQPRDPANGETILVENTRFSPMEETNDPRMSAHLASCADAYVNDAFSAAHRAHASTEGVAHHLPSAAGRLMQKELEALEKALSAPDRPVVAVVGGAKVSTKLALLGNLIHKVDQIVIGGGMANTFLAARGIDVGKSLCEHDLTDEAERIAEKAVSACCEIVLPTDVIVAREFKAGAETEIVAADACPADAMILDTGPASVANIATRFEAARTLVWNGPLGAFEIPPFNAATDAAALKAAELTRQGKLLTVAGGGDTVAALNASGAGADFSYVSTAGGAFLEWLEGKTLPGVAMLYAD
ncbi:MAG: phosphoglycerate kinase [Pseudomonadota bacterium]